LAEVGEGDQPRRFIPFLVPVVCLASFGAVAYVTRPAPPLMAPPAQRMLAVTVVNLLVGGLLTTMAALFYWAVVSTAGFTFDYSKPVLKGAKGRSVMAILVVNAVLVSGLAFFLAGVLNVLFWVTGLRTDAFVMGTGVALLVMLTGITFVRPSAPIERTLASRRLTAMGVPASDAARGLCVGSSDLPDGGWKASPLEDDLGLLWVEQDRLVYKGDQKSFDVPRETLRPLERVTVAPRTRYRPNRPIVLRFGAGPGRERRVRLQPAGCWTAGGLIKATNALADRLNAWMAADESAKAARQLK
jgi:hypothetical protein